ncbi:hypothetical protein [Hyphomicrobium sp. CS1GBMeth3]|uniref:hypothetical protein n=1 Tax=Hyphomicrobium sp. CS1GBMeth3 TaxID=1892845 RepID=UPI000930B0B4|nr:hypothetical protein [Hyphomicrobium sp. CS1GBMeth3]
MKQGPLSERLQDAIASELEYSEHLINLGLPLKRRVLILGTAANGELSLGELYAATEEEMLSRIGELVTAAMLNSAAREFVVTEPSPNGTFSTYGVSATAHGGFVASRYAPFDEDTLRPVRWSDGHVSILRVWIPEQPTRLNEASAGLWQAMVDVAPGGAFEMIQIGGLAYGFSAECGHA